MAKVKTEIVEAALLKLIDNINATLPDTKYKFLLGGAAGMLGISGIGKLKDSIAMFQDENGLVDTEKLKAVYQSAFKASGGQLKLELFNNQNSLLSLFVKPLTLTLTQADIDQLMAEVESNAAVNEVSLSPLPPSTAITTNG